MSAEDANCDLSEGQSRITPGRSENSQRVLLILILINHGEPKAER